MGDLVENPLPRSVPNHAGEIRVRIEKLVYGGEGLARLNGQVILVPYALPGEEVAVQTRRVKSGLLRGTKVNVVEPSPGRVQPVCEYFGNCGGCHYQHSSYNLQLEAKAGILRETLRRIGSVHFEDEIRTVAAEPWGYRNRIQLHFSGDIVGFHRAGSHEVYGIEHCYIASPLLNEAITKISAAVRQSQWPRFLRSVDIFTNEKDLQLTIVDTTRPIASRFFDWCATFLPNFAPGAIDYTAAGHTFRISRGAFFQVNRFLIDRLVEETLGKLSGVSATDLYAGAGLFTLPLRSRFETVSAIERGGPAYRDLEWNTRNQGRIDVAKSTAENYLELLQQAPELIVADPPRAGLGTKVTAELLRLKPARLVLVSCDPATLARDLKALLAGYRLDSLTLLDLFPQTYHFETVAHLSID